MFGEQGSYLQGAEVSAQAERTWKRQREEKQILKSQIYKNWLRCPFIIEL